MGEAFQKMEESWKCIKLAFEDANEIALTHIFAEDLLCSPQSLERLEAYIMSIKSKLECL